MRGRLISWVFRALVLWGAQRLIRWFSERYGENGASRQPGAGGPQAPRLGTTGETGKTAAAGTDESSG